MKKIILSILTFTILASSYAQQRTSESVWTEYYHTELHDIDYDAIEGSPYASNVFIPGKIYNGTTIQEQGMLLRYNIYTDVIEVEDPFKNTKGPHNTMLKSPRVYAYFAGNKYVYVDNFIKESGSKGSYLIEMYKGKNSVFYKKQEVTFYDVKKANDSYEKDKPASFRQNSTYYLKDAQGNFIEIPDNKSKAAKAIPSLKKEAKIFIKENNIDFDDHSKIIQFAKFIDSKL